MLLNQLEIKWFGGECLVWTAANASMNAVESCGSGLCCMYGIISCLCVHSYFDFCAWYVWLSELLTKAACVLIDWFISMSDVMTMSNYVDSVKIYIVFWCMPSDVRQWDNARNAWKRRSNTQTHRWLWCDDKRWMDEWAIHHKQYTCIVMMNTYVDSAYLSPRLPHTLSQ